jgi:hypothetical protein
MASGVRPATAISPRLLAHLPWSRDGPHRGAAAFRRVRGMASGAQLGALLAANGHRRPATPGYTGPGNTWPGGTSSHVRHHPATLYHRLIVKQVHKVRSRSADPRHGDTVSENRAQVSQGRCLSVPQDLHRHPRVELESGQQRPASLPDAAHGGNPGHLGLAACNPVAVSRPTCLPPLDA